MLFLFSFLVYFFFSFVSNSFMMLWIFPKQIKTIRKKEEKQNNWKFSGPRLDGYKNGATNSKRDTPWCRDYLARSHTRSSQMIMVSHSRCFKKQWLLFIIYYYLLWEDINGTMWVSPTHRPTSWHESLASARKRGYIIVSMGVFSAIITRSQQF